MTHNNAIQSHEYKAIYSQPNWCYIRVLKGGHSIIVYSKLKVFHFTKNYSNLSMVTQNNTHQQSSVPVICKHAKCRYFGQASMHNIYNT